MKIQKCLFFAAAALVWSTGAFAQTPANDDFANRIVLSGSSVSFGGSLAGATLEPNEPAYDQWLTNGATGSLWWTWTAPVSTTVVMWFTGPQSATNYLEVFTGTSFGGLTPVRYIPPPAGRYMAFPVTAGTAYQIQVLGADTQPFKAQLTATNAPVFVFQPQDSTVSPYGSAVFSAMASGPPPSASKPGTTYQWYFNGALLPGQTFPSLLVHGVTTNQAGTYSVTASNIGGLTVGGSATLTVVDTNPMPRVTALQPSDSSHMQFTFTGEPGRWYKVESTPNLQDWFHFSPLPIFMVLTNETTLMSIGRSAPNYFARVSLDRPTYVCIAQLKQMRWAAKVWMIETMQDVTANADMGAIRPYLPLDSQGRPPVCPDGGTYSASWPVTVVPTCTLGLMGRGHAITDQQ